MKQTKKLFYRISISVVCDGKKYDLFVIDNDEDLQVLFHCHRQFSEVRTHELLAKFRDVGSSSGGSNWNRQSVPMAVVSSSTPVVVSSSLPIMVSTRDLVTSPSFTTNLHCDEIAEIGDNKNTPVMIPIFGEVGEPDVVEGVLGDDDDVEPVMIDDGRDDDIGRSIPVGASGSIKL
ncbi:hypothetical protein AHAS_Ahas15G0287400 [Arachis hypogaea]|uniref:Uncharacterized protein n=1 Tax=Arachis hypogaea TaxID=3818 RepID=A0A444Z277_ARAHY|nr:hypothetical protein Ahy_B05g075918 [Arachis hypogaea]